MSVKEFLTTVGLWAGGVGGLLVIVNWSLSEGHKKWLQDKAETLWVWLDDQRSDKLFRIMRARIFQYTGVIFSMVLYVLLSGDFHENSLHQANPQLHILRDIFFGTEPPEYAPFVWVKTIISLLICIFLIIPVSIERMAMVQYRNPIQAMLIFAFPIIFILVGIGLSTILFMILTGIAKFVNLYYDIYLEIYKTVVLRPALLTVVALTLLIYACLAWIALSIVISALLRIVDFVLLRLIDDNKGIVFSLSVVVGGVAAFLKPCLSG